MTARQRTTGIAAVVVVLASLLGLGVWGALQKAPAPGPREPGPPAVSSGPSGAPGPSNGPTTSAPGTGPAAAVDWARVRLPLDCSGVGTVVTQVLAVPVAGQPRPLQVVEARCDAGAGSPPSAVLVYDLPADAGGQPVLRATLLSTDDDVLVTSIRAQAGVVEISGTTYSGPSVPRCCPDRTYRARWAWSVDRFVRQ